MKTKKTKPKFLSKLCKENNPEACKDCLNIKCKCYCHNTPFLDNRNECPNELCDSFTNCKCDKI